MAARKYRGLFERLGRGKARVDMPVPPDPRAPMMVYLSWVRGFWRVWTHTVLAAAEGQTQPNFQVLFDQLLSAAGLPYVLNRVAGHTIRGVDTYLAGLKVALTNPAMHLDAIEPAPARLMPLIDQWRIENLRLIKGIGGDQVSKLAAIFKPAQEAGTPHKDLIAQVKETLGIGERRAKGIARDQTTKFNGSIQSVRQQEAGITEFEWCTSKDGDVRPSHKKLQGQVFSWANLPVVDGQQAYPGSPPNCRCQAKPKIALFADLGSAAPSPTSLSRAPQAAPTQTPPVEREESSFVKALNERGVTNTSYLRTGMRPASLDYARGLYSGATAEEAQGLATSLKEPIRIHVEPGAEEGSFDFHLNDGRHRLQAAREAGAMHIKARVVQYGPRGGKLSDQIMTVKIGKPDGKRRK